MFRIESYITPIILNHVAKYVKNIRSEDAQVSLWEGEVAFQNLDLRLDVLEEELNLPFEFLSGHIHELSIQVPWTKITSEPIRIIINTIEFVLKLKSKSADGAGSGSSASSSPQRSRSSDVAKRKRLSKQEEQQQVQQSAGSGLVNKIINNIVVQCHNIILKYVEEDIILSMNVQLLSFSSADELWKPNMVDVHPLKVLIRKLVQISDLTICLDKRNAAGQIDVCQEPILYRCTIECRILRKYHANTMTTTSTTRIGVFTKCLDVNVSSLQFPMVMRLINLVLALKTGKIEASATSENYDDDQDDQNNAAERAGSYLTWAWNLLPTFNFEPLYEEEQITEPPGHTRDIGIYVEEMNFTLKNSEFVMDTIMGTAKRIRYTPIIRISLGGMYYEGVSSEEHSWSSTKAGISSISVEPLGTFYSDTDENVLVESQEVANVRSFIDKSLFDDQAAIADKSWGVTNYDEYAMRFTDEYLLYRSPILAFDLVEYKPLKLEEAKQTASPVSKVSDDDMQVQYRLLSAGVTFRYCQTFLQVKQIINDFVDSYDYPAYYADGLDTAAGGVSGGGNSPKLHPPLMEDYDALMVHIPYRSYRFSFQRISFEIWPKVEPETTQKQQRRLPGALKQKLLNFHLYFDNVQGSLSTPLQPDKVVHTTCQLPEKPPELLNACYDNYQFSFKDSSLALVNKSAGHFVKLVDIPTLYLKYSDLLQPQHWKDEEIAKRKLYLSCDKIIVEFSKRELISAERLMNCVQQYQPILMWKVAKEASRPPAYEEVIKLHNQFNEAGLKMLWYQDYSTWNIHLKDLQSVVTYYSDANVSKFVVLSSTNSQQNINSKWLEWYAQFPGENTGEDQQIQCVMALWVEQYKILVDKHIIDFLKYQEEPDFIIEREPSAEPETVPPPSTQSNPPSTQMHSSALASGNQLVRRISRNSLPSRKQPEETIHFSSERDEKLDLDTNASAVFSANEEQHMSMLKYIKSLILNIEIGQGQMSIAESFERDANGTIASEFTRILFPKVTFKSLRAEHIIRANLQKKIALSLPTEEKYNFNWTVQLDYFGMQSCSGSKATEVLKPTQTTITIALTHKKEKLKTVKGSYSIKDELQKLEEKKSPKPEVQMEDPLAMNKEVQPSVHEGGGVSSLSGDAFSDNREKGEFAQFEDLASTASSSAKKVEKEKDTKNAKKGRQTKLKDEFTINIHADTTPIHFLIETQKITALQRDSKVLLKVMTLLQPVAQTDFRSSTTKMKPIQIVTATEQNAYIKEFLDLETNSESSKFSPDERINITFAVILFCQWTITKIRIEVEGEKDFKKSKLVLELEDLLSTVDQHEDYNKYTSKIGNFNLNYYEPNAKGDWKAHEVLRIKLLGEATNLPFFNIIFTCVGLKDFYKKLGIQRKSDANRCISEILIVMQGIDMILDLERAAEFLAPFSILFEATSNNGPIAQEKVVATAFKNPITAADLPMIHLNSKGIRLYLPLATGKDTCSVIIWQMEQIKISPNLINPLQRNPIRADVYSKAGQMGILTTPGSMVEDRQYELTFQNISAASGNWGEILTYMREQANDFHRTNPAFEWNNPNRKPSLQLTDIFSNFTIMSIYAPSIVYNNVLICGEAVEFNCASDFVATINTCQLNLFSCMILGLQNIAGLIQNTCNTCNASKVHKNSLTKSASQSTVTNTSSDSGVFRSVQSSSSTLKRSSSLFHSIDENTEQNVKSDSGFLSCHSQLSCNERLTSLVTNSYVVQQERLDVQAPVRHVPHTLSLVAGIFIIKIFDVDQVKKDTKTEIIYKPLFLFTISQPSFMLTQNIYDSVTQISLFNLHINIGGDGEQIPPIEPNRNSNLFAEDIINTRPGVLGTTGIPPPLFRLKLHATKMQQLELEAEMSKTLIVNLGEKCAQRVFTNMLLLYKVLLEKACFEVRPKIAVVRGSKIKLMRRQCFNADILHIKCAKMELNFADNDCKCRFVCRDTNFNVKFIKRPEKATVKGSFGSIYLKTDQKIFVHPIALRISADFVSEPWYRLPLIMATAKLNAVRLDVTIKGLLQLHRARQSIDELTSFTSKAWRNFLLSRPPQAEAMVRSDCLWPLKCPSLDDFRRLKQSCSSKKLQREEFYQDDLRAGAFQIVEMMTDSFLPLPYQIQIIKKDFGIICWRYPQPRRMCKIHIFPVPMPVPNPIHIKCRMEYFSETQECFQHYCDFWLSETVLKEISLPKREICANIWRVVILQSLVSVNGDCFDTSEEDEELRSITSLKIDDLLSSESKESDFILHPKVLVCCMRIDTCFQSESVPKIQCLLSCNLFEVQLLNQPDENSDLPQLLKKFRLAKNTHISQAFLAIQLERMKFNAAFYGQQNFTLDSDLSFCVKCLDYGFLNMVHLLDQSTLQSYVRVNASKRSVVANVLLDRLRFNFGPSVINTLLSSKTHWEENLTLDKSTKRHALIPKYIIVNRTYSYLAFGQTGTNERVHLHPKESYLYSFRSDYHSQELTFFINANETLITEISQSVPIVLKFTDNILLKPVRIGNKCIIIKSRKLSATQIYVMIKGQIEMISMVPHDLRFEFRRDGKQDEDNPVEYSMEPKGRGCVIHRVQRNTNITMRLKLGKNKGKARSGDIPLRTNKNLPWLVKVPTQNNEFISFWVRILREDIPEISNDKFQPQKILVTIWPIFEICSMLNRPLSVHEGTTNQVFSVPGEGGRAVLNLPVTHLTDHELTFQYDAPIAAKSKRDYTLSLKSIDWYNFFWYDEQTWNIEHALYALSKAQRSRWPMNDDEEMRLNRYSYNTARSDIGYKRQPTREFSCALCLEVSPWGLFINATGLSISVCDLDTRERLTVDSNCLEMMFSIKTAFTIDVSNSTNWISSLPIYFEDTVSEAKVGKFYVLSETSSIDIVILREAEILKLVLALTKENDRKILKLRSKFVLVNFTKTNLCVLPFAMDHKETSSRAEIKSLDDMVMKREVKPAKSVDKCIGRSLDYFCDIKACKAKRSYDTAFVCFVCVKVCSDSDISIPIPLSMAFSRRCFSIQHGSETMPLVVTLIEKDGIYYLCIFEDTTPAILINNQTEVKFIVAQTTASEYSKVSSTTPEYDGRHFEWFQLLHGQSTCYYTPPEMYASFPDVESTTCNLTLALYKDDPNKKNLKWSKPLRTDKSWEKFLHVPQHGDVKVTICDKHRVIRVSIYYIKQQLEFSVKDLRSRLLTPQTSVEGDPNSEDSIATVTNSVSLDQASASPSDKCVHFLDAAQTKTQFELRFCAKEIVVTLQIDSDERDCMKSEVFGLYVDDFMLSYDDTNDKRQLNMLLGNLQIDNQLYSTGKYDFPVVLCAEQLYNRTQVVPHAFNLELTYQQLLIKPPMAMFTFSFFDDELKLNAITCSLSPVRAYIEDAYLNSLLEALLECEPSNCVYKAKPDQDRIILLPSQFLVSREIAAEATCIAEPLQLRSFRIEALNLMLSVHTSVRLYIALDHSPLSFSAYERQQVLTVPLRFGQSLGMHYLSGALFGAGWVVGSLEILGSPSGLARSFSTGLRDFVSMPVEGLFRGPWGFIVGITQGSASLLRNVTAGTVNSLTKLASSVARNLDRLSLDQEHIDRTDALRRCRPQGFTEGLSQGITGLGISILGAVGGLAHHTLEARTSVDVITGVGKGIVGAFTKPISGAAELVALAGQGVLHTVGFNAMPQLRAPSVCHNVSVEPSGYRIWKLLPGVLESDQILFYHEVTLIVQEKMLRGYAFLTSSVFAIMEVQWDKLAFAFPVDKVELKRDSDDKTLYYVKIMQENEDIEENLSYTNQRILTFLNSSHSMGSHAGMTTDSLHEMLQKQTFSTSNMAWAFYIDEHMGEHITQYLQVLNTKL